MPINPLSNVLQYPKREDEDLRPIDVDLSQQPGSDVSFEDGAKKTELPDGSVEIDLDPSPGRKPKSDKFNANLAEDMAEAELNKISTELLDGIARDDESRKEHLEMI